MFRWLTAFVTALLLAACASSSSVEEVGEPASRSYSYIHEIVDFSRSHSQAETVAYADRYIVEWIVANSELQNVPGDEPVVVFYDRDYLLRLNLLSKYIKVNKPWGEEYQIWLPRDFKYDVDDMALWVHERVHDLTRKLGWFDTRSCRDIELIALEIEQMWRRAHGQVGWMYDVASLNGGVSVCENARAESRQTWSGMRQEVAKQLRLTAK